MERETEVNRSELEARIKERDSQIPSPELRARSIWNILNQHKPKPTLWDMVCFSVEALGLAVTDYPFLVPIIKHINKLIYGIHYESRDLIDSFIDTKGEFKNERD